jgi:hypothetical protein
LLLSLGNIASAASLQNAVVDGGALIPLVTVANTADLETQRCIAYSLCNLASDPHMRAVIVKEGGESMTINLVKLYKAHNYESLIRIIIQVCLRLSAWHVRKT